MSRHAAHAAYERPRDEEAAFRLHFSPAPLACNATYVSPPLRPGVAREDLFICGSVLSNRVSGREAARDLSAKGCRENMEAFNVGAIHSNPNPNPN